MRLMMSDVVSVFEYLVMNKDKVDGEVVEDKRNYNN